MVTELVLTETVSVMKVLPTLEIFVWTCVKGSTVEAAVLVQVVSVAVMADMLRLKIFAKKHVRLILVRN